MSSSGFMGFMRWQHEKDGVTKLYLKRGAFKPWLPYDTQPESLPESRPTHSKGWNTYQKLLSQGWQLIPSQHN